MAALPGALRLIECRKMAGQRPSPGVGPPLGTLDPKRPAASIRYRGKRLHYESGRLAACAARRNNRGRAKQDKESSRTANRESNHKYTDVKFAGAGLR